MKHLILFVFISFLVGCNGVFDDGTCGEPKTYTAPAKVLRDSTDNEFYCEQMENYWNIDAKEVINYIKNISFEFVSTDYEKPEELPKTISFGNLTECELEKAPSQTDCMDTRELSFSSKSELISKIIVPYIQFKEPYINELWILLKNGGTLSLYCDRTDSSFLPIEEKETEYYYSINYKVINNNKAR